MNPESRNEFMLAFYKKAISLFFIVSALTLVFVVLCVNRIFVNQSLFPADKSAIAWQLETITDVQKGGSSSINVYESNSSLDYDYVLADDVQYPHVTTVIAFTDLQNVAQLFDMSRYSKVQFRIRCEPRNSLAFHLHSFDPQVTNTENFSTFRIAEALFSCDETLSEVEIDLQHLNVATWWLESFGQPLSDPQYWLDKVVAFSFGASRHGPLNSQANVKIVAIQLQGLDWRYIWALVTGLVVIWLMFGFWFFKRYTQSLVLELGEKLRKDRPLMAYQQLSIKPHRDREKGDVLRFMATEFANPEMNLDYANAKLGINRSKINEILKDELGFTFNAYLNQLRLVEAARLLSEKNDVHVADIAYEVGFNNVSYFNKLFKNEYGCTPKMYRGMSHSNKLN